VKTVERVKDNMKNYKVYVKDRETSIKVQEPILANGIMWSDGTDCVKHTEQLFLYLNNGRIWHISEAV